MAVADADTDVAAVAVAGAGAMVLATEDARAGATAASPVGAACVDWREGEQLDSSAQSSAPMPPVLDFTARA
jgi:hypothetical protein